MSDVYSQGSKDSLEYMMRELNDNAQELDDLLDVFHSDRSSAILKQKQALANYEAEMEEIEEIEFYGEERYNAMANQTTPYMDANILRHIGADRQVEYYDSLEKEEEEEKAKSIDFSALLVSEMKKKKLPETDLHQPPPTFEEKKKIRENIFNYLEESTIEETRLELELDAAKEKGDTKLIEEISSALFLLQKLNGDRLAAMIGGYKPQAITRVWGSDPEYSNLARQLTNIAETYNTDHIEHPRTTKKHGH